MARLASVRQFNVSTFQLPWLCGNFVVQLWWTRTYRGHILIGQYRTTWSTEGCQTTNIPWSPRRKGEFARLPKCMENFVADNYLGIVPYLATLQPLVAHPLVFIGWQGPDRCWALRRTYGLKEHAEPSADTWIMWYIPFMRRRLHFLASSWAPVNQHEFSRIDKCRIHFVQFILVNFHSQHPPIRIIFNQLDHNLILYCNSCAH